MICAAGSTTDGANYMSHWHECRWQQERARAQVDSRRESRPVLSLTPRARPCLLGACAWTKLALHFYLVCNRSPAREHTAPWLARVVVNSIDSFEKHYDMSERELLGRSWARLFSNLPGMGGRKVLKAAAALTTLAYCSLLVYQGGVVYQGGKVQAYQPTLPGPMPVEKPQRTTAAPNRESDTTITAARGDNITLVDIFISVKTTSKNENTRLPVILKTWFQLAKEQVNIQLFLIILPYRNKSELWKWNRCIPKN